MSEEEIPTTPHDNLNSSSVEPENMSKGYLLAQQLCNLQQENLVVGKQNQELALQFQDASNYNQALGYDLFQLDQEIGELEERLANMKTQIKEIDQQTKQITKQADDYKNTLRNDKEFTALAKQLRDLQKTHQSASKSLNQLRELLGDPQFSMLEGSLQLMQEKIHFLYWSNTELHQQIELMQQLLNEGREGAQIEADLEKMNDLYNYKLEYYDMKLFESKMKNMFKSDEDNESESSSPIDSTKYILTPSNNNKQSFLLRKFQGKKDLYEDILIQEDGEKGKYKIFRRPLKSDGKSHKYRYNNSKTKKFRQTRVRNKDGDEYEYQYEYEYDKDKSVESKKKRTRVDSDDEEIEKIGEQIENLNEFKSKKIKDKSKKTKEKNEGKNEEKPKKEKKEKKKSDKKSNLSENDDNEDEEEDLDEDDEKNGFKIENKEKIRRFKDKDGQTYIDTIEKNENTNEREVHRRLTKSDKNDELKYSTKKGKNKTLRHSRVHNLINSNEVEYEYEYENDEEGQKKELISKNVVDDPDNEIIPPIILKTELRKNRRENQGFNKIELDENGKKIRKSKVDGNDGEVYEDVLETDNEGSQRITRNILDGQKVQYEEINQKGKKKPIKVRRERIQNDDMDEYEYEYQYDENESDGRKKRKEKIPKNDEMISEIGIGPVVKFKKQKDKNSDESVLVRKVDGENDDEVYEDVITTNDQGELIVTRRPISKENDGKLKYSQKTVTDENGNKKKLRVRKSRVRYEDGHEDEFEYEYDDDENTRVRKYVPKEEETIEPITGVPKLSKKNKSMLSNGKSDNISSLSTIGYKDEVDPKTGRKIKVRFTEDEFGNKFIYSKEQDLQTKETRFTKRQFDQMEKKLKYNIIPTKDQSRKLKMRLSEARIGDSEREYEYEYENEEQTNRKKLSLKDEDGFHMDDNKRIVLAPDGKEYEDTLINEKIYRRPFLSLKGKNRRTRVRNADDEEYEYEYESGHKKIVDNIDDEIIPRIKLSTKPRRHKFGPTFSMYRGRELRHVLGKDGNEYEDEKIGKTVKRSKIDHKGKIEYKTQKGNKKGKKQLIKQRHVLILNSDDEEIEYEYQYEFNSDNESVPQKTRKVADEPEIESIFIRSDFKEKTDPKTNKVRLVRQVQDANGDLYEDEIDQDRNKIIRRQIVKDGSGSYSYQNRSNHIRVRRTRIGPLSPVSNQDEYEYEYEYDDNTGEVQRRRTNDELLSPFDKLNPKRYMSDSSEFVEEEEDPETGEIKKIQIANHSNMETIINPATFKPVTVRQNGKDYEVVFDPKTNKTLRQRKVDLDNNSELVFEYDDEELDENGNPSKSVKKILNKNNPNQDSEGFYEDKQQNGIKVRHLKGKIGSYYIDTKENEGKIRRRVVNSSTSNDLIYKKKNNKLIRHSRVHYKYGDEKEYEYEYENEDDDDPVRKVVDDESNYEIDPIKKQEFKNSKKYEKAKSRIKRGENGELYEDTIKDNRITRRPLDKNGEKLKYKKYVNGVKTRRSRVSNQDNEEYEYEYEEDDENITKTRVHPSDEKIERIDGAKSYKGGFYDQYQTVNGSIIPENKRKIRKVKGSNGQIFEDELVDGKIKRRPLNRKNKISYKKKNNKTVRRERVRNNQGDEYEYEYEYDQYENCHKVKIDPEEEAIEQIEEDDESEGESEDEIEGFSAQKNEKTGRVEKSRKVKNNNGQIYKDTIEKNDDTGEEEIHRRLVKSESTDELEYSTKSDKNNENKIVRHSRTHNLNTGDETEYEYEYETDESGGKINNRKKKNKVENPDEEIIPSISVVHSPKRNGKTTKTTKKPKQKKVPKIKDQSEVPQSSENGIGAGFHLPVSLFQSEDQARPRLKQSSPDIVQQSKPATVDFTEFENVFDPDKKNPLALLIPKLRAESGQLDKDDINTPENLKKILETLQQQIVERTEFRDSLKERIKELENPHYVKKNTPAAKKSQKFKMSAIKRVNIESPPDPIKILALNNYDLRHIGSQTDITGETIMYHQTILDKQRKDRKAAEELRAALETLKEQIRTVESKIEKAKEDAQFKEERIKTLKSQISNVKDELMKEDQNTLREEEKAREYAQQLSEVDEQIREKQKQLEKINSQVGALHLHYKEMQKFRIILESELANLVNREKPEIRQLIEDVNSYRIQIDVSSANVESMTKKIELKRQQLEELLNSDQMNQYTELKLQKVNLERRIKKWSSLMKDSRETLQSIETFSAKNANARRTAIEKYKNKIRSFMKQEMELDDLEKYQELVEAMIREHKQNWM